MEVWGTLPLKKVGAGGSSPIATGELITVAAAESRPGFKLVNE